MVFDWDVADKFLQLECTHYGYVIALYLVTRGEMIIVGDLMKSVSCLFYDVNSKTMSIHCRDFDTRWITSVETLESSQVVIGSDNYKNLFTLQKDTDNRGMAMVMGSRFHLGELVNRFRRGKKYHLISYGIIKAL
jgi:DNA damage-binding protein 1